MKNEESRSGRFLTAEWRWLAMLNYEIDPDVLRPLVPRGTELDLHDGKAFVSVVGFLFLRTKLLGLPIPFHRNFEEVNLRFYLRREVGGEVRRGVAFIKELVPRWAIATVARWAYNENYQSLPMRHSLQELATPQTSSSGRLVQPEVRYEWRLAGRWQGLRLKTTGQAQPLLAGSREEFITEHYWGYCAQRDGGTVEYQVAHPAWNVWQAAEAELVGDMSSLYGERFGNYLAGRPASAFLADGSPVSVFPPQRIGESENLK